LSATANLTPDFYAVNTMQPLPAEQKQTRAGWRRGLSGPGDAAAANRAGRSRSVIAKGVSWGVVCRRLAGGASRAQNAFPCPISKPSSALHYFAAGPGTLRGRAFCGTRAGGSEFIKTIDSGGCAVTFYKPQAISTSTAAMPMCWTATALADIVAHLQRSAQWAHMVVIVTYDENGGFWDHVALAKGRPLAPGLADPVADRLPYARQGLSIRPSRHELDLALYYRRFDLPPLAGLRARDAAFCRSRQPAVGDMTGASTYRRDQFIAAQLPAGWRPPGAAACRPGHARHTARVPAAAARCCRGDEEHAASRHRLGEVRRQHQHRLATAPPSGFGVCNRQP